jgi:hypothetical protein
MPGKHVRFADDTNTQSPPSARSYRFVDHDDEPTPPLTYSYLSSSPSSVGLITPPSPHYPPSPLPYIAVQVSPLLACSSHGYTSSPALTYAVSMPPSAATISSSRQGLDWHILNEPATHPPLPTLTLLSSTHLPWPIIVSASTHVGVTVGDLLTCLYRQLRRTVSEAEFRSLPGPDAQSRVSLSFQDRYRRISDPRVAAEEKAKGLKRVDFLMGRVRWMGLSSTKASPDRWILNLA